MEPRISFVLPSRNDDHPVDGAIRRQVVVSTLIEQLERLQVPSEIILVDWNPPADRPRLAETLRLPARSSHVEVRAIEVPHEEHAKIPLGAKMPYLMSYAPNVGLRRARGRFAILTTQDHLFSDELISFFGSEDLDERTMYRIDRRDVPAEARDIPDVRKRAEYCAANEIRVHTRRAYDPHLTLHTDACGDFILLSRRMWHETRGFLEDPQRFASHNDSLLMYQAVAAGATERVLQPPLKLWHMEHASRWQGEERWYHRLRFDTRIPWAIRSLYWTVGSRLVKPGPAKRLGIDAISAGEFRSRARRMLRGKETYHPNGPDWGIGNADLPEQVLVAT